MGVHCLFLKTLTPVPIVTQIISVQVQRKSKMTAIRDCETILLLMPRFRGHKPSSVQPSKPHISHIKRTNHPRQAGEQSNTNIRDSFAVVELFSWSAGSTHRLTFYIFRAQ